ncbi:MAG: BspA family leucine-rich repeat surface protein [Allomuricauda sp.]
MELFRIPSSKMLTTLKHCMGLILFLVLSNSNAQDFITTWKTNNPGVTESNQILIPTFSTEIYDYTIDWGDGNSDSGVTGDIIHTYTVPGTYQIAISGVFPGISLGNSGGTDREKLLEVNQWGNIQWRSFRGAFSGAVNMQIVAEDVPDLSQVSTFRYAFVGCTNLIGNESMNLWDMSAAVNLSSMFYGASSFNTYIGDWDLSNVEDLNEMFRYATSFNQDIGNWRFPKVTELAFMFDGATNFNGDISGWDVSNIEGMAYTFQYAEAFNKDISSWDMGNVISTGYMFNNAKAFNQDISGWDVSKVRSMAGMFTNAISFDQNLSSWDVQSVITMSNMFKEVKLSSENYDAILNGWASLPNLQNNVGLDAGFSQYCNGESAKQTLINNFGWQIKDGGAACSSSLAVKEIYLVDAVQDEILYTLRDDAQINRKSLPNQLINFEILTSDDVGSVKIELSDTEIHSTVSNEAPFTLFGVNGTDYMGNSMSSGTYTIVVTPYSGSDLTGTRGESFVLNFKIMEGVAKPFITTWKIDSPGYLTIRTIPGEHYYYDIKWSDGYSSLGVTGGNLTHYYDEPGTYQLIISGKFPGFVLEEENLAGSLVSIDQWGDLDWKSMERTFSNCENLDILATDIPDLSNVESMAKMFQNCKSLIGNNTIGSWDTSQVNDMSNMFKGASVFNQNIADWNVSKVASMAGMFEGAAVLDQDLGNWNISQVTDMGNMFNQSALSNTNYESMLISWSQLPSLQSGVRLGAQQNNYCDAAAARQDLIADKGWIIHDGGLELNCAIDGQMPFLTTWKTDNRGASNNNQITIYTDTRFDGFDYTVDWGDGLIDTNVQGDIIHTYPEPGIYRVAIYGDFLGMYINNGGNARLRDDDKLLSIDQWGDIEWELLHLAFAGCDNMDMKATDIPDFTNGPNLFGMFSDCKAFIGNESINSWDLSAVDNTAYMFHGAESFNLPLDNWNTGNVLYMYNMFQDASAFNQDLGSWNVSNVIHMTEMFDGSGLSDDNYNKILMGWAGLPSLQQGVQLDAPQNKFCEAALSRYELLKNYDWVVNDQGRSEGCTLYHPGEVFVTKWQTNNPGISEDNQILLPLFGGPYNVDWGDGSIETDLFGNTRHTYSTPGTYKVSVFGRPHSVIFSNSGGSTITNDAQKLLEINQWGVIKWSSMNYAFRGCANMDVVATDVPDLSNVSSMFSMFNGCESLRGNDSFNTWDIGGVQNLQQAFSGCKQFNTDISNWNTGNVTSMGNLFEDCEKFNGDISGWDVSKVENMNAMFSGAVSFNQNIGSWNVSSVTNMESMFELSNFNNDISNWDVSNVGDMGYMFSLTPEFNQDISSWNVSKVQNMDFMFSNSQKFNQDISNWDVSEVITMRGMFNLAEAFNQDISKWNVSNVLSMYNMFFGNNVFDQNVGSWNISNVVDMTGMFADTALSLKNYDNILQGWASLPNLRTNVIFDAGSSMYCESAQARQFIIDTYGWTILDAGEDSLCSVDMDGDGVFDYKDACQGTSPGVLVNTEGCDLIPNDAIKVQVLSTSCVGSSDGAIEVGMTTSGYLLDISIEGDGFTDQFNDIPSGTDFTIDNLSVGNYTITVFIPEILFEQTYGVTISGLDAVSGKRMLLDSKSGTVLYAVTGSKTYEVLVNDKEMTFSFDDTSERIISLEKLEGQTEIAISGQSDCQGIIQDNFYMGNLIQVFPTITSTNVNFISEDANLKVKVFGLDGKLVRELDFDEREKSMDISSFNTGIYIVQMENGDKMETVKIIKR